MAAVLAKGTTVLDNAAREPEIVDLCRFLDAMGAQIEGIGLAGRHRARRRPRATCRRPSHRVVADRVEAATYLAAVGLAGGELTVRDARAEHMEVVLRKLRDMGLTVDRHRRAVGGRRRTGCTRSTWPRCPTRAWRPTTSRSSPRCCPSPTASGSSPRTCSPGASATSTSWSAWAPTSAPTATTPSSAACPACRHLGARRHDIRAGAALVVAALAAEGETSIDGAHHVDRGYEDLVGKLRTLGADIVRLD